MAFRVPILRGALAGAWWLPAGGGKVVRVLTGSYEPEQTKLLTRTLRPGGVFLDLGAHHGYYTLLASRVVGPDGTVIAFEPSPRNAAFLREHVRINRADNVEVMEVAISDADGEASFRSGSGSGTGRLGEGGELRVPTRRLDSLLAEKAITPAWIKIDVEGAELRALHGARSTLQRHRPVLFLSTHGRQVHRDCCEFLRGLGYRLAPILGGDADDTSELIAT